MTKIDWILLLVCIRLAIDFVTIGYVHGRRIYYILKERSIIARQIAEATGPCKNCLTRTDRRCLFCRENYCSEECFNAHLERSTSCGGMAANPPEIPPRPRI